MRRSVLQAPLFDETDFYTGSGFWGGEYSYSTECCPRCNGEDFGEAKECEICGKYYDEDELIDGVCEKCIDRCRNDEKICLEVGDENKEEIKINSFLLSMFDEKDIEAILAEQMKKQDVSKACNDFIDNDIECFAERLKKGVRW